MFPVFHLEIQWLAKIVKNYHNIFILDVAGVLDMPLVFLNPSRPVRLESCIKIKTNLNFYFHTSLWALRPS